MEVEITVIEENFETIDSLEKILNLIKRKGIQIEKIEYLYYPYWIISLTVIVKQLFGVREFKKVHLMIEGLTGIIGYCEEPRLKGRYAEKEKLLEPKVKKPGIEEKIKKFILETFPRECELLLAYARSFVRVHHCFTLTGRFTRPLPPILMESGATLHQPLRAVQPYGCYEVIIFYILRVFKPYPPPFRKGSCKQQEDKKFWILDLFNPGNGKRTKLLIDSVSGATEYVLSYDSS